MASINLRKLLSRLVTSSEKSKPWPGRHRTRLPLRLEVLEDRTVLSIFTVTNTNDSGFGSLRQAILNANADPFVDTIAFAIAGGGVQTIQPASELPALTKPVVIDGTTQPGFAGTPLIVLDGGSAGRFANGLTLTGGNSTVEGLVINNFGRTALVLSVLGGDSVLGNYLGTDVTGTHIGGAGNNIGLEIDSANNVVVGTASQARNLISSNSEAGILINGTGNVVLGNYIGTDVTGSRALGDGVGVAIGGSNNRIGGAQAGARNVISGCASAGVSIAAEGNLVQGNYIGTDASGTVRVPSGRGVYLLSEPTFGVFCTNNTIGGTTAAEANLIAGNLNEGVVLENSGTTGNRI